MLVYFIGCADFAAINKKDITLEGSGTRSSFETAPVDVTLYMRSELAKPSKVEMFW